MRKPEKDEILKGKYIIPISNNNGHNYELWKAFKITGEGIVTRVSSEKYYNGLVLGGNCIVPNDFLVFDDEETKIIEKTITTSPKKYTLKYINDVPRVYYNSHSTIINMYNSKGSIYNFSLAHNVTDNCQIAAIRSFKNSFSIKMDKKDYDDLFISIFVGNTKPLLLIDVNEGYEAQMSELFDKIPNIIHLKTKYISSNNSRMILYLINIKTYINYYNLTKTYINYYNLTYNVRDVYFETEAQIQSTIQEYLNKLKK